MDDADWPLKSDRRAAVLCLADDSCLKVIVEPRLGIKTHRNGTKSFNIKDNEVAIVKKQRDIYTKFISPDVPYKIVPHDRFNEVNGAKVVATKHIPNKTVLFELCGQLFPFSNQFLVPGVNDFSTVASSTNDRDYMFLGPVAFINHDCKPNVQWHSRNKTLSCVNTIRSISSNEEITVWYGPDFFGLQNCECQCQTCEDNGRGFYSKKAAMPMTHDDVMDIANNEDDGVKDNDDDSSCGSDDGESSDPLIPVKNTQKVIVTQPTTVTKCSDMEAMPMTHDDVMDIANNEDDGVKANDDDSSCGSDDGESSDPTDSTTDKIKMDPLIPVKNTQKVIVTQPTTVTKCSDMEAMPMTHDDVMDIANNEDDGVKANDDDSSCGSDDGESSDPTDSTTDKIKMDPLIPVKKTQKVIVTQPTTVTKCSDVKAIPMTLDDIMDIINNEDDGVKDNDDDSSCGSDDGDSSDSTNSTTDEIPEDLYECRECKKQFKYKSWYMNHSTTHSVTGAHRCRYCPKLFKRRDNLERHFLTHFGGIGHDCTVCGRSFLLKHNLKMHIDMQHKLLVKHKCSKCKMVFKDQRNLRYHDNVKHTYICPFKCPCGQAFGAPNLLTRHRRQNNH